MALAGLCRDSCEAVVRIANEADPAAATLWLDGFMNMEAVAPVLLATVLSAAGEAEPEAAICLGNSCMDMDGVLDRRLCLDSDDIIGPDDGLMDLETMVDRRRRSVPDATISLGFMNLYGVLDRCVSSGSDSPTSIALMNLRGVLDFGPKSASDAAIRLDGDSMTVC